MKAIVLFMILQSIHVIYGQSSRCEQLESDKCSSCLEIPGCAWCSQVNYGSARCQTLEEHETFKCNQTVTGNPDASPTLDTAALDNSNQISPKKVKSRVRVGEPLRFQIDVQPAQNYPVDFYYLMDLTETMANDLDNLKTLALNISAKLSELTSRHRLAFGSFIDKVVPPYVREEKIGKPFRAGRDEPYDFKHVLSFTSEAKEFEAKINEQVTSGNRDLPEGTFDALMQVAACENKLGWGDSDKTRRMVLIATDGPFHIAGEGKFGGVVKPNDERCWLGQEEKGVRYYTKSLELDYPSVNQVYQRLKASHIIPIFAIGGRDLVIQMYRSVVESWDDIGATMGKLDENSGNIIKLIQESYDKITSKVILNPVNTPEGIEVDIKAKCGESVANNINECNKVKLGQKVTFDVSITATSCKYGNSSKFELRAVGLGGVNVELDIICSCDCENHGLPNSTTCNKNGTLVCGACQCNEGRSGRDCQCDATQFTNIDPNLCKNNETGSLVCAGNGACDCGVCKCNSVPGHAEKYYGEFCQCSNFDCPYYNDLPCGGPDRAKECKCGKCICKDDYIGSNCDEINCAKFAPRCHSQTESGVLVNCSNHGTCDCGKCKCEPFYEGPHCEKCQSCAGRCGDYKQCVLCKVFGDTPSNATLCDNCPVIRREGSLADLQKFPTICTETDDEGCTYHYSYVNRDNTTIVYAVENKDCPAGPDVLLIVLVVIGSILGIGILLLILWKVLTALVDRREYQKFEQDRAKSKWHREKNPLYQPATSTVQNPTFVGSKS